MLRLIQMMLKTLMFTSKETERSVLTDNEEAAVPDILIQVVS